MSKIKRLGENLTREWSEDPYAAELWDALKKVELDPAAGLVMLHEISDAGSPLSMMHLGHIYLSGQYGITKDVERGEYWLNLSADAGSFEGRYRLAKYLMVSGRQCKSLEHFNELAAKGYSPAMFSLGYEYYRGKYIGRDLKKSMIYLECGQSAGNLHARVLMSHILIRHERSFILRLRGLWLRVSSVAPVVYYIINYPQSDRVRR